MIAARELLETSIGQLRTLTAFLREQVGEGSDELEPETAASRACDEILAYLTALIVRVEGAGANFPSGLGLAGPGARVWRAEANGPFSNIDNGSVAALYSPVAYTHQDDNAVDARPGVAVTGSWLTMKPAD
jgi:hypothetical protein